MTRRPRKSLILTAAFLVSAALAALAMALCGVCPFGSRSLGVQDMTNQYLAFLSSIRDILSGRASALYLPSMALGGNMLGLAAYYLMSPLNLITCLFPREDLLLAVSLLYILRVGLAGTAMAYYAGRRHGWGWRVLFAAPAYGLMAYMVAFSFSYLWQDCVILLPLVALGLHDVAEGRGRWLYVLTLAAALVINFYIGYILCLFAVLFFLGQLLAAPEEKPLRRVGNFALSSLLAGALAAVVLLPAFLSLSGGKASFSPADLSLAPNFPFPAMFSKLFYGAFDYEELMEQGLPHIFCGALTLALAALYFANRAVPRRKKLVTAGLIGILLLSFWLSGLDLIWHGFNVPTWYNHRYSFLLSFLLIAAADEALAHLRDGTRPWHFLLPPAAVALLALLAFAGREYDFIGWQTGLLAVIFVLVLSGGLWLLAGKTENKRLAALLAALLLLCHLADLWGNAAVTLDRLTGGSADPAKFAQYVTAKSAAMAAVPSDGTYVRTESEDAFMLDRDEPMLFGYDGLSHYGSTLSQKNLDFLEKLGVTRFTDLFVLYNAGVTAGADSFLGVKYLVSPAGTKAYTPLTAIEGYTVYENTAALPMGFTADETIAGPIAAGDCFAYIQALYSAAAPEVDADIYTPADITDISLSGLTDAGDGDYILADGQNGSLTYTLAVRADGPLYAHILMEDYPGLMLYVNGAYRAYYGTAQTNGSLYLGDFTAGDTAAVRLDVTGDLHTAGAAFATEDMAALSAYHDALASGGCALEKLSGSHFAGSFTTGQGDALLLLTIPYDAGWHVTLDGADTSPTEVQDCLMALPVEPGEHTLDMRYVPPGLIPGAAVSSLAVLGCLALGFWERKKKTA